MKNLKNILYDIFEELEIFEKKRDEILKKARDIINISRKLINSLHLKNMNEVDRLTFELRKKVNELLKEASKEPRLIYSGFMRDSLKEYVEAILLYTFQKNFPQPEETTSFPSPSELGVPQEAFILGVVDFLGELKRVILTELREKRYELAWRILDFIKQIVFVLETKIFADSIIPGYKARVDGLKKMIVSIEELILKTEKEDRLISLINNMALK